MSVDGETDDGALAALACARRPLLAGLAASLAAPALAARGPRDPLAGKIVINTLGGIGNPEAKGRGDFSPQVLDQAHRSGLTAAVITLAASGDPYTSAINEIAMWSRLFRNHPDIVLITQAKQIAAAKAAGKIGIIYGFQNTSAIGSDLNRVDMFHDFGLRVIQLTYNVTNPVGSGAAEDRNLGLTPFGREMVARLNQKRIIVDLSHSNYRTCLDAAVASSAPIAITHTGCSALYDLPRNKTDEELRAVAEKGGYVGIYFFGMFLAKGRDATVDDVAAHIEHAIKVCGEDHVGIGTDAGLDPAGDVEAARAAMRRTIEARRAQGISAAGEIPGTISFIPALTGPDQFRRLAEVLAKRGHSQARIDKIMGANFVRYAAGIWGN